MHIAEQMRKVLPELKRGINGVSFSGLKPELEEDWSENYALLQGLHYTAGIFDEQEYFDHERLRADYEDLIVSKFPGCDINIMWRSQEIEISKT
jgi:hypothetical protein